MSRIGKLPITFPSSVNVKIDGKRVEVTGPKGTLTLEIPPNVTPNLTEGQLTLESKGETKKSKMVYGTTRALIANMVKGVNEGFKKVLEISGTGYRAEASGNKLVLTVGYSHPVEIIGPKDITFKVEKTDITVEGIDKQVVGQLAAKIRFVRPPEPYKGKGIKYKDEVIRRKAGKAAKTAA